VSVSSELLITLPAGVALHARPAGSFVKAALGFKSHITVSHGDKEADAKSILAVLALGADSGSEIRVRAEGEDADAALEAVRHWSDGLQ
jgi:phosphotransferase system HPr (HPr) family protein